MEKVVRCSDDIVMGFEYALEQLGVEIIHASWDDEKKETIYRIKY